jgi:acetyl esterase/lipase
MITVERSPEPGGVDAGGQLNHSDVEWQDLTIAGLHGKIPARAYRSRIERRSPGLVWMHGGGFVAGDLDMPEAHWVSVELAARGVAVLSVDYRKCLDGVHFPIPSDDVLDAWLWAIDHLVEFGAAGDDLHFGGASAGAALAAGVTKRLRDGAGPLPTSVLLVYPIVHRELPPQGEEMTAALEDSTAALFTPEIVRDINLNLAGGEENLFDVYAFAANGDLSGQPPVFVLNSEADSLRASGEAYGRQLRSAGVKVRVEYEPGSVHGHLNEPLLPPAGRSIERMSAWLSGGHASL